MKRTKTPRIAKAFILNGTLAALVAFNPASWAQSVPHLTVTQPGGFPGVPVMTGISIVTNGIMMTWDGPSGYYQLVKKASLKTKKRTTVGGRTLNWQETVAIVPGNAFFAVSGPSANYLGSQGCTECHAKIQFTVLQTPHAGAFTNAEFVACGGQTNPSCVACHTVGYELPTGFISKSATPQLANVQCENCHGPAANHAANPNDFTVIPQVEIAATVCGGCHNGPMQPTYAEWNSSGHAAVVPGVLQTITSSTNNISSCGRCHSGSVRLALLDGQNPLTLTNDLNVAITCVVCHDPHQTNIYPAQLRNPLASTNYYSLTTTTNFSTAYDSAINICAQCHNSRGAAWMDTSRAPHHSQQYNLLLGSVGELTNGSATYNPGSHAGLPASAMYSLSGTFYLTNQCISCHMQSDAPPAISQSHAFTFGNYNVCLNCHPTNPDKLVSEVMFPSVSNRVYNLKYALDYWAANNVNPLIQTNGVLPWEYTTPGGLIWQTNQAGMITGWTQVDSVNFTGPNSAGQALIPDNIKRARFNLYLVLNDGSFGVHNPYFTLNLLDSAYDWVLDEIFN
jgi:Cytochrome c554 and c-prime